MFIGYVAVSAVLAALLVLTSVRKLSHDEQVVRSYARVGVPEHRLGTLTIPLFAGAAGLLAGLFWPPIGIAAAVGLIVYFVLAALAHVRHRDTRHLATPLAYLALAVAALVLRSLSA